MSYSQSTAISERLIRPVLCIGIPNGNSPALLPFMCVDFIKNSQRSKRVLINWTYGKPAENIGHEGQTVSGEITFDGELGQIKLLQLQNIQPGSKVEVRYMLPSGRGRTLSERIREVIELSEDGSRVLFVLPKSINDSEFYAALSIFVNPDSKEVQLTDELMGAPVVSLKELGHTITAPFIEVDPRQFN